ncbi:hypothetical protein J1D01_16610 [Seonamhaeicola sp. NFXS20]|uniref:hypothetical protein n=1 Tax=Seonamhaeicola sp. NFXS20 TaxID=2816959 RepID=UPI003B8AAE1A
MSETKEAKISISIIEGKFEISGSEEFVNKQIENFKEVITKTLEKPTNVVGSKMESQFPVKEKQIQQAEKQSKVQDDSYSHIYVVDDEKIRIICDIPGKTAAEKTLNTALIYAFAKNNLGIEEANVGEIKTVCQNHGFLDKVNYSTHIKKGDPKLYLDKGSGKERAIKLVRPGIKKAKEIIELIVAD